MSKNTMHDSTATASRPGTGNTPAPAALRLSLIHISEPTRP